MGHLKLTRSVPLEGELLVLLTQPNRQSEGSADSKNVDQSSNYCSVV